MKLLIVGSGGREHALAWKVAQSDQVKQIYIAPGNAGTASEAKCENVSLTAIPELLDFAKANAIDLTIVGPEALLVDGIADEFEANQLPVFAPKREAAQLEGSKALAKDFMQKHRVKTAAYATFRNVNQAIEHTNIIDYPIVIKASGLAAGKGVVICQNQRESQKVLREMMLNSQFGHAGDEVVIEEFITGFEASILTFCDGKTILPLISAKDHKKIGEGETGLNTGGMGVIAPHPQLTSKQYNQFLTDILQPTLRGIQEEKIDFKGVIFFGLMINEQGVYLLEYNVRFGDPETQAVLPLLETDLLPILQATINQELDSIELKWKGAHSCCVVAVSGGYPQAYEKGKEIVLGDSESQLFIAGAQLNSGKMLTSGGRVLNVVAVQSNLELARQEAYESMKSISFDGMTFRNDIGLIDKP